MNAIDTTDTAQAAATAGNGGEAKAPYTSFATLMSTVDRMKEQGGAPDRVDRSYLSNLPGGAQTVFLASCKSLGLIDDDLVPTAKLNELIAVAEDQRKAVVGKLIREFYVGPLSLSERATQHQLEEEFRKLSVTGSTLRKAVGFFLAATRFAEIPVSPNFKLPKAAPSTPRKRSKNGGGNSSDAEQTPPAPPATGGLPTIVGGLVEKLPKEGETWTESEAHQWLEIAKLTFPFVYSYEASTPNGAGGDDV